MLQTYSLMSEKYFTHASPTLFNACSPMPQLSSCFLLSMTDDSIEGILSAHIVGRTPVFSLLHDSNSGCAHGSIAGIYETLKRCAKISKTAGGIGLALHNIRAGGSYISGTNGQSNGIVPMLRVYNQVRLHP